MNAAHQDVVSGDVAATSARPAPSAPSDLAKPAAPPPGDPDARSFRAKISGGELGVVLAVAVVAGLAGAGSLRGEAELRARKAGLLTAGAVEAATLTPREAGLLDLTRELALETATAGEDDVTDPVAARHLDALLARSGLYFRAAAVDLTRPSGMVEAARSSTKDALSLCLLHPPASTADADITVAATRRLPGSEDFNDATDDIARLETVQRGLRVLTPGWANEVKAADAIALRTLSYERERRTEAEIVSARGWSGAGYFVAVIDELPAGVEAPKVGSGLAESMRTAMLPALQDKAHAVRIAVFDLATHKLVLRMRRPLDVPAFAARTGVERASAVLAEDCAAGAAVRWAAASREQASR